MPAPAHPELAWCRPANAGSFVLQGFSIVVSRPARETTIERKEKGIGGLSRREAQPRAETIPRTP